MRLLLLLLLLASCSENPREYKGSFHEIPYRILIGGKADDRAIASAIDEVFAEVDAHYNNWDPASEISRLNALPAGIRVPISEELKELLLLAGRMHVLTEGRFDPTVWPLCNLWRGRIPSRDELEMLLPAIGWKNVHIKGGRFWKDHDLTAIDLGGIAKGYAVDLLSKKLSTLGYANTFVEWGGEIRTTGRSPHKRPWKVGLAHTAIELSDEAIATSGDTYQFWEIEGKCYFHILDPKTYSPLQKREIAETSVIASSCAEADAIATSLMLFSTKDEAVAWAESHPEYTCSIGFRGCYKIH